MTTQAQPQQPAALAKIDKKDVLAVPQLREMFSRAIPDLTRLYPKQHEHVAPRLARAVVTEVQKNETLAQCTGLSLLSCAVQAAQLHLEIGGPTGQAYMVPYWNKALGKYEAQFQLGYRGMITLAYRSNRVASIRAVAVRQGDTFAVQHGTNPGIDHRPGRSQGPITHVYAVVNYRGGGLDFEVMTAADVDQHRAAYSKQGTDKNGRPAGIWQKSWEAMALKTVIRRLLKRCPVGVDVMADELPDDGGEVIDAEVRDDRPALEGPRQVEAEPAEEDGPGGLAHFDAAEPAPPGAEPPAEAPQKAGPDIIRRIDELLAQAGVTWEDFSVGRNLKAKLTAELYSDEAQHVYPILKELAARRQKQSA